MAPTHVRDPRFVHANLELSGPIPRTELIRVVLLRRLLRTTQLSASIPRPVLARVHRSAVLASSLCHDSAVSPCPQRPPAPKLHCFAKPQTPLLCVSQLAGAAIIILDHLSSPPSRDHTRTVAVSQSPSVSARKK
ncbi:hypothetical protein DY000_02024468 [Brassica cretica]|uniref:Uncharacterized protein n=1 Tax=Brassica cretica TaxID=69181 RepID=A0ABQ7E282_BRACR|nr:hypothetical protein DY000_02024468 [Brassica cretica]